MRGFSEMFKWFDFFINCRLWDMALVQIYKIQGAIFYACEMELIDSKQAAELAEMVEERRNLIP